MKYSDGYKYRIEEDIDISLSWFVGKDIYNKYFIISNNNNKSSIKLKKDYLWDGANMIIDRNIYQTPSAVHDAFYQCFKNNWLPINLKSKADQEFGKMVIERGSWRISGFFFIFILKRFGKYYLKFNKTKKIKTVY